MRLFKNVDICDIESIMKYGVLSLNECGNDNWDEGKRSNNSSDLVYLFRPLGSNNAFPKYGVALLAVDVDAVKNQMSKNDAYYGVYDEYVVKNVDASLIKHIYIPKIFKHRIDNFPELINSKIVWCDMRAKCYSCGKLVECDSETLSVFAESAEIFCANTYMFFRGVNSDRTVIDLYDIEYIY